MGCASSTPMVQTAGSDMLKAASHVADDATKTAEEAVQGVKETVGKTLENAKETVATKVEEVKHEVETTLKEKAHDLDDAKNSILGKLNLNLNNGEKSMAAAVAAKEDVVNGAEGEARKLTDTLKQSTETTLSSATAAAADVVGLARTDTETDSLRTSTPEPEIERALANTKSNSGDGDDDNPPTPKPTFSELENLSHELLQQQHEHGVNDSSKTSNDPPAMTALTMMAMAGDTASQPNTNTDTAATTTTNSSAMHIQPIPIVSASTIATAIAASTAGPAGFLNAFESTSTSDEPAPIVPVPAKTKASKRDERHAAERARQQKLIHKLLEEKRPRTTEWEKYADMLALFRKFNPHDAFRRNGTLTKFNGHGGHIGGAPIREKPFHGRGGDDDSSDTTSVWGRKTPLRRSSARQGGRQQRQTHRPTSASNRSANGSSGRSSSNVTKSGRKFDFNPNRSRVNERVTSSVSSGQNLVYLPHTANAYRLSPPFGTQSPTQAHESVKSPLEMRSQHTPLGTNINHRTLEPLRHHQPDELFGQQSKQRHFQNAPTPLTTTPQPPLPPPLKPPGGSSMPPSSAHLEQSPLTRESSTTSLSSQTMYPGQIRSYKSSLELRMPTLLHPLQQATSNNNHQHLPPVRNTSSFLSTPRTSPFGITKSYTDLYFSSTSNKENEASFQTVLGSMAQQRHVRDTSPYRIRERCEFCSKKYIKT